MEIVIDPQRCIASGVCAALAPRRFEAGLGASRVLEAGIDIESPDVTDVASAIDVCPGAAITLAQEVSQ